VGEKVREREREREVVEGRHTLPSSLLRVFDFLFLQKFLFCFEVFEWRFSDTAINLKAETFEIFERYF